MFVLDDQEENYAFCKKDTNNSTSLLFRLICSYNGLLLSYLVFSLVEFNDKFKLRSS